MLTPNNALALRIAETLKNRCTHETLPGMAEDVGFALGEATSKRDRVLSVVTDLGCEFFCASCGALAESSLTRAYKIDMTDPWLREIAAIAACASHAVCGIAQSLHKYSRDLDF